MTTDSPDIDNELFSHLATEHRWAGVFEGLSEDETAQVCARMTRRVYPHRTVIFTYGSEPDGVLVVHSGRIKMYHSRGSGAVFNLAIWPAGYTVGLLSTLLEQPRIVTVESVEDTTILTLSPKDLRQLMREIPTFSYNIARLAASLAKASLEIASPLALDSAAVRLSNVLIKLTAIASQDSEDQAMVVKGLSQDDLASMVGVSRTWLTLMLSNLESHGLIWRKRLEIGIKDPVRLIQFCERID